jgi:hypothetical protein
MNPLLRVLYHYYVMCILSKYFTYFLTNYRNPNVKNPLFKEVIVTKNGQVSSNQRETKFWTKEFGLELTEDGERYLDESYRSLKKSVQDSQLIEYSQTKTPITAKEDLKDAEWINNWVSDASEESKFFLRVSNS